MSEIGEVIWEASEERKNHSHMKHFKDYINQEASLNLKNWDELYKWSIEHIDNFWKFCSSYVEIKWHKEPSKTYSPSKDEKFLGGMWFEDGNLNFAENILPKPSEKIVLTAVTEGLETQYLSAKDLWNQVACCQSALKALGVKKGDCVAGVIANGSHAIIAMLAATSLGAIWSSCSPDFGAQGIIDRLGQVNPKVLFFTAGYSYNGKYFSCDQNIQACKNALTSLERVVLIDCFQKNNSTDPKEIEWNSFINSTDMDAQSTEVLDIEFETVDFNHPVYIMFSSGTTGVPKCITHGTGGTLLQHKKELLLHTDIKPDDKLFYFTTCGWMMWNWMVSTLATDASLLVFDGSPGYPNMECLWNVISDEKVTIFGTSPKYMQACINQKVIPKNKFDLSHLKTILSTGAPLLPEHFDWVYRDIKEDLHLASISGGTDIISCFLLGNPLLPVRIGYLQAPGLGMAVESWNEEGQKVLNQKGELVCKKPFVSMPVCFWGDSNNKKYHAAYFEQFPNDNIWAHGDFIQLSNEGAMILGRSDATLNPGGVRIGTAEIYRQVEKLEEIDDSIAIGMRTKDDVEIALFVKLSNKIDLDDNLTKKIKSQIKSSLTPRHIPSLICQVADIPYTRSGKKVEIAATKAFHGESINNLNALMNPESIEIYSDLGQKFYKE